MTTAPGDPAPRDPAPRDPAPRDPAPRDGAPPPGDVPPTPRDAVATPRQAPAAAAGPRPAAAAGRRAVRPWPRRLALLALVLVGAFGGGFAWFVNQTLRAPESPPLRPTDAIAVLTGGRERVETGLRLLAAGHARRMVISGVHRDARLADLARAAGLDPAPFAGQITVGRAAATTRGNAAEIAAWVRAQPEGTIRSLRVVTAGYHMPRALLELRRAVPGVELVPHPVTPPTLRGVSAAARLRTWSLLLGEYTKFLLASGGLSRFAVARSNGDGGGGATARMGTRAETPRDGGR